MATAATSYGTRRLLSAVSAHAAICVLALLVALAGCAQPTPLVYASLATLPIQYQDARTMRCMEDDLWIGGEGLLLQLSPQGEFRNEYQVACSGAKMREPRPGLLDDETRLRSFDIIDDGQRMVIRCPRSSTYTVVDLQSITGNSLAGTYHDFDSAIAGILQLERLTVVLSDGQMYNLGPDGQWSSCGRLPLSQLKTAMLVDGQRIVCLNEHDRDFLAVSVISINDWKVTHQYLDDSRTIRVIGAWALDGDVHAVLYQPGTPRMFPSLGRDDKIIEMVFSANKQFERTINQTSYQGAEDHRYMIIRSNTTNDGLLAYHYPGNEPDRRGVYLLDLASQRSRDYVGTAEFTALSFCGDKLFGITRNRELVEIAYSLD